MVYLFYLDFICTDHLDKACDQTSNVILDAYITKIPNARIIVEYMPTYQQIVLSGGVNYTAKIDTIGITLQTLETIGYHSEKLDLNPETTKYQNFIHLQSSEINQSISNGGAEDKGHTFGRSTKDDQELLLVF